MSCYFAPPLRRMARNIRNIRGGRSPFRLFLLFKISPIIAHFSRKSFL